MKSMFKNKVAAKSDSIFSNSDSIQNYDSELWSSIENEFQRQEDHIELIASENYASKRILEAQGSVLTNKYAEGYPSKRYYGGCEFVDIAEEIAISRAKELFNADYANVQPHSGSSANAAAFLALLEPNDTILGMSLDHGGHLTHGAKVNFSGRNYKGIQYGLHPETNEIDYDQVRSLAHEHNPKLIIAGFSAYSGIVDWKKFREIADEIGAYFLVDMAHVSGLVAAGLYPSPVPYADVVTSTTHKTLRGPRSGIILARKNETIEKKLNSIIPELKGEASNNKLISMYANIIQDATLLVNSHKLHEYIKLVWSYVNEVNKFFNDNKPWELFDKDIDKFSEILALTAESIKKIAFLINPIMPDTSNKILNMLGVRIENFSFEQEELTLIGGNNLGEINHLFSRIDDDN